MSIFDRPRPARGPRSSCTQCGQTLTASAPSADFCSPDCQREWYQAQNSRK